MVESIITVLLSSTLAAVIAWFLNRQLLKQQVKKTDSKAKKTDAETKQEVVEMYRELNEELRGRVSALEDRVAALELTQKQ